MTNYVCYPGGAAWVRWERSKEVTMHWVDRLTPTAAHNSVGLIERRTDLIELADWPALDALADAP